MNEIIKFHRPDQLEFVQKRSVEGKFVCFSSKYFVISIDSLFSALVDLCKLSFDYIKSGNNEEKYKIFAENTGQTPEFIQGIIEVLLEFLIDAVKNYWNETHLQQTLTEIGLKHEQINVLSQFVESKREIIMNLLKHNQTHDLRFRELDWRLEAR